MEVAAGWLSVWPWPGSAGGGGFGKIGEVEVCCWWLVVGVLRGGIIAVFLSF